MRIRIRHETRYRYAEPVLLAPHRVRLRPREGPALRIEQFDLRVAPGRPPHWFVDPEGNSVASCWFAAPTQELSIVAESDVRTSNDNPYDFLLDDGAEELPVRYDARLSRPLAPYRALRGGIGGPVAALAHEVRGASGPGTLAFLGALCLAIAGRVRPVRRERGAPRPPSRTLARGEGACRDLAVLYAYAARAEGLAARFVSGYVVAPELSGEPDLHAWSEVYLPGAGWRGYDPARSLAVDAAYVPLAAAARPADAAPVSGTYLGSVRGTMSARVTITHEP